MVIDKFISENDDCKDAHDNVCKECCKSLLITIMKAMNCFAYFLIIILSK